MLLFSQNDQSTLSKIVHKIHLNLRSIRKGALQHYSCCGVDDNNLMLLSGHKRKDTLLRYLGWRVASGEATRSAAQRLELAQEKDITDEDEEESLDNEEALDEEDIGGAGETDWLNGGKMEGLKMGCHSGYLGVKGRRTKSSPFSTNFSTNSKHHTPFFFRCPKSSDLSLKPSQSSFFQNRGRSTLKHARISLSKQLFPLQNKLLTKSRSVTPTRG